MFFVTVACLWSAATLIWLSVPAPCFGADEPHRCGVAMGCGHATEQGARFHRLMERGC